MALTLEAGPWSFSVNNAWASSTTTTLQSKNALMAYKAAITGVGWSVVASSNGSTVKNVGDGSPDLWLTVANITFATSGVHSWIIFKDTVMNFYLAIDCIGSTGPNPYAYIYYNNDIGTNGTTSALPSGTKHTLNSSTSNYWTTTSTAGWSGYVHAMKPTDGKGLRLINTSNSSSNGFGASVILIEKLADTPSVFTEDGYYFSNASLMNISASSSTTSQSPYWSHLCNQTAVLYNTGSGRTLNTSCNLLTEAYWSSSSATPFMNMQQTGRGYGPGYPATKFGFFNTTLGHCGRVRDLWLGTTIHPSLTTYPSDGSMAFVKFGMLIVPWSGATPQGA